MTPGLQRLLLGSAVLASVVLGLWGLHALLGSDFLVGVFIAISLSVCFLGVAYMLGDILLGGGGRG